MIKSYQFVTSPSGRLISDNYLATLHILLYFFSILFYSFGMVLIYIFPWQVGSLFDFIWEKIYVLKKYIYTSRIIGGKPHIAAAFVGIVRLTTDKMLSNFACSDGTVYRRSPVWHGGVTVHACPRMNYEWRLEPCVIGFYSHYLRENVACTTPGWQINSWFSLFCSRYQHTWTCRLVVLSLFILINYLSE